MTKPPSWQNPPPTNTPLWSKPPSGQKTYSCKNHPLAKTPLRQKAPSGKKNLVNPFTVKVRIPNAYINLSEPIIWTEWTDYLNV